MGNESSVPTADNAVGDPIESAGDVEEKQPKVPALAASLSSQRQSGTSHTPKHTMSASNEKRSSERASRPAARMIGAVFGKGNRGNNGQALQIVPAVPTPDDASMNNSSSTSNSTHEGSIVPQTDDCARAQINHSNHLVNDQSCSTTIEAADRSLSTHDVLGQAQQQSHIPHQKHPQTPLSLIAGSDPLHQQEHNPHAPHDEGSADNEVYERDNSATVSNENSGSLNGSKKSIFPGRATSRGAALISSMRNLTLGSAFVGGLSKKKEVNDWEKQWDADEDDDSEEGDVGAQEVEPEDSEQRKSKTDEYANTNSDDFSKGKSSPQHHRMASVQPAFDAGHSELHLANASRDTSSAPGITNGSDQSLRFSDNHAAAPLELASLQPVLAPSSKVPPLYAFQTAAEAQHDLAAEWDMAGIQPPTAVEPNSSKTITLQHPQQLTQKPVQQQPEGETTLAKPNVHMFLPMLRVLGKGSFGKVVLVQKRVGKERGGLFAMKILRKTHLVKRRQIERTRTERKVLSVVNHPFIMKLHYAFQTPDKLYLVLDYCPGGELFFHLSRFRRFPERVARFYAAELLLAIGHLHKRGIIYRDLKPENVLLDSEGHVKLGDFGLAKSGIKHPCEGATSMCGTPEYMAPEVLAQAGHGFCVDYWGLGMLLYEMMTGLPPWYTTDRAKLFRRLKSAPLDIPSYFSVQAANCVSALLERNPRRRLGVTGIRTSMEHEFFRNISWKSLYARRVEAPIRPCEGWKPPESTSTSAVQPPDSVSSIGASNTSAIDPMSLVDAEGINPNDLDDATKNFDNTFTRMPVESEEMGEGGHSIEDHEVSEQLNSDTFLGFSFDSRDREPATNLAIHASVPNSSSHTTTDSGNGDNIHSSTILQQYVPSHQQYQQA